MLPIINSVAVALGSEPEKSPRRVGHYLMMSIYMVTKTTSYMFFTAMAGNILALKMINDILHLQIRPSGWMGAGRRIAGHHYAAGHPAGDLHHVSARN